MPVLASATWIAGAAIGVASVLLSAVVTVVVLVRLPADYFVRPPPSVREQGPRAIAKKVAKNGAGVLLIALGVVLSLPGVPGQGVITILLGLSLIDGPGKRRLELAIVKRRSITHAIDRLRARFHKPPLELPC